MSETIPIHGQGGRVRSRSVRPDYSTIFPHDPGLVELLESDREAADSGTPVLADMPDHPMAERFITGFMIEGDVEFRSPLHVQNTAAEDVALSGFLNRYSDETSTTGSVIGAPRAQ